MYLPSLVFPYHCDPGLWYMPDAVFTQTIPLLLAGGVCCAVGAWEGVLAALGVAAGAAAELLAGAAGAALVCVLLAGAGAAAGAALDAGVLVSDFFVRAFLVVLAELAESAAAVVPAAGVELSAVAAFFDLLLEFPLEALALPDPDLSDPELSAASAFLEALFLSADLLLSVELAESVPAVLFLDFDLDALALSAAVELSAVSVLLLLDLVLLPLLAAESVPLCAESLAVVFFLLLFFLAVVELSAWSCEPDEPACCALVLAAAHKSSQAARTARIAPLRDLIFRSFRFFGVCGQTYSSGTGQKQPPKGPHPIELLQSASRKAEGHLALIRWAWARIWRASGMPCGRSLAG